MPFETDDYYYLIRMTRIEAQEIIEDDDDYDDDGILTEEAKDKLEEYIDDPEEWMKDWWVPVLIFSIL